MLSEIHLDRMDAKKFLLFFIPFDLHVGMVLVHEVDSKKITLAIVALDCRALLLRLYFRLFI